MSCPHTDTVVRARQGAVDEVRARKIDEHLQECEVCASAAWISGTSQAAGEPEPLSPARQAWILNRVHVEVAESSKPASLLWRYVAPAGVALAVATVALVVWSPRLDRIPPQDVGWLGSEPGVRIFVAKPGGVTLESTAEGSQARVDDGLVFFAFDRKAARGPLRIVTPHAEVLVRGTMLYVRADERQTAVGVEVGTVDVSDRRARRLRVRAGELVKVVESRVEAVPIEESTRALLRRYMGVPEQHTHEISDESRSVGEPEASTDTVREVGDPSSHASSSGTVEKSPANGRGTRSIDERRVHSKPRRKIGARGGGRSSSSPNNRPLARAASDPVSTARRLWRSGQAEEALALLEKALGSQKISRASREEALYLKATIHRGWGEHEEAVDALRKLATGSRSQTARLAELERARLLAHELGDYRAAREVLEPLVRQRRDVITEDAQIELCVTLIELRNAGDAKRCLEQFLELYPQSTRMTRARKLWDRIERAQKTP